MFDTREGYLQEALSLILDEKIIPATAARGFVYDKPNCRVSLGWPKGSRGGQAIAQCFRRKASSDGVNEIFVTPEIDDPIAVLEALAHEGIHATDDCASGHRNFFAAVARAIGLEGKLTATHAGEELRQYLQTVVDLLGEFPHHKMDVDKGRKKQGIRQLKVQCSHCGLHFRSSAAQLATIPGLEDARGLCPSCHLNTMQRV